MCFGKKPVVKYVETYKGWVIIAFPQAPTPLLIAVYTAVDRLHRPRYIEGVDLPDLKGDVEEAMK